MRTIPFLFLIFLTTCAKAGTERRVAAPPFPSIPSVKDFGLVFPGTSCWFTFHVANTTQEPFYLFEVTTSCGCMVTSFTPCLIEPSTEIPVEITLKPRPHSGRLKERVRFFSSNSDLNSRVIDLTGFVAAEEIRIPTIDLGLVSPELGAAQTVRIDVPSSFCELYASLPTQELLVINNDGTIPTFIDSLKFLSGDDKSILEFSIGLEPSSLRGLFQSTVRLYLNQEAMYGDGAFMEIPLVGSSLPFLYVTPGHLKLSSILDDSMTLQVYSTEQADVEFALTSGVEGPISWRLSLPDRHLSIAVDRASVPSRGPLQSLRIPFKAKDADYDLVIPVYP